MNPLLLTICDRVRYCSTYSSNIYLGDVYMLLAALAAFHVCGVTWLDALIFPSINIDNHIIFPIHFIFDDMQATRLHRTVFVFISSNCKHTSFIVWRWCVLNCSSATASIFTSALFQACIVHFLSGIIHEAAILAQHFATRQKDTIRRLKTLTTIVQPSSPSSFLPSLS